MSTEIKAVTRRDIAVLVDMAYETFFSAFAADNTPENMRLYAKEYLTEDRIAGELETDGSTFFFVVHDGEPAGYLKLNIGAAQTDNQLDNALEIERIYVQQGFQGKGLGKVMFNHALETARQGEYSWLWLGVWDQNHHAIEFYKRQGLSAFSKHGFMLGTDEQTDILMRIRTPKECA